MKSEKLAIFVILTFILIIASFNIIGSLTMLIIEKEKDIKILRSLGASDQLIKKIFIYEGWMISVIGAIVGLIAGFLISWVQQRFGLIRFNSESLLIDAYPVVVKGTDLLTVGATVLFIGYLAALYPVHYLSRKFSLNSNK
jgi:ABC-type lipoprotein release transport system permease subunit